MDSEPPSLTEAYDSPRRTVSWRTLAVVFFSVIVVAGVVAGTVTLITITLDDSPSTAAPASALGDDGPLVIDSGLATNHTELYENTIPSVVSIYSVDDESNWSSQGSGFVYDEDGHIVTNEHVVRDESVLYIQYSTGEWSTAELVGADVYTDLAVLEPDEQPEDVDPLPMTTRVPKPGESVIALGSPHDLAGTITSGIVSGVERSMRTENNFVIPDSIQTDAGLNPGNSGGPLVGSDGRVIGVNRAKQGDNIGFAVSSRLTVRVTESLIKDGQHDHSYVGIEGIGLTPQIAEANEYAGGTHGVMVTGVQSGTPADGVLRGADGEVVHDTTGQTVPNGGDVIVAVDDVEVRKNEDLSSYLMRETAPGEEVELTVLRDGEEITLVLELGHRPEFS